MIYKYTIEAWDEKKVDLYHYKNVFEINKVEVEVFAKTEDLAIAKSKELIKRREYVVIKIEVIEKDESYLESYL